MNISQRGTNAYAVSDWHIPDLQAQTFWVFDLEGTGGHTDLERVTQFGALKVRNGQPLPGSEFMQLVNPGVAIRPFIAELTGIDNERVKDAPTFATAFARFISAGAGCVWVSHSAFEFDVPFLLAECARAGLDFPLVPILDTKALYTYLQPQEPGPFGTRFMLQRFGIELANRRRHDALGDARLAADILCAQLQICRQRGIDQIEVTKPLTVQFNDIPEAAPHLGWAL